MFCGWEENLQNPQPPSHHLHLATCQPSRLSPRSWRTNIRIRESHGSHSSVATNPTICFLYSSSSNYKNKERENCKCTPLKRQERTGFGAVKSARLLKRITLRISLTSPISISDSLPCSYPVSSSRLCLLLFLLFLV